MSKNRLLLINPWIYDFAAFNLWVEPIGLLSIGSIFHQHGYQLDFIDCLDRYNPDLLEMQGLTTPKGNAYGTGKYHQEPVERPEVVKDVPRHFCRYGITPEIFESELDKRPKPDVVLVTSKMTYWYPGTARSDPPCQAALSRCAGGARRDVCDALLQTRDGKIGSGLRGQRRRRAFCPEIG